MSTLETTLQTSTSRVAPPRGLDTSAAPLVRLLATVALASAAAGGLATLALERLMVAVAPPRLAPAVPTSAPLPAANPLSFPPVHDVLRDRAEPPIEPPPAS